MPKATQPLSGEAADRLCYGTAQKHSTFTDSWSSKAVTSLGLREWVLGAGPMLSFWVWGVFFKNLKQPKWPGVLVKQHLLGR